MSDMEYVRFGELYKIPSCNGLSRPSAVRGEGYKMVNMGELFSNDIINDMYMERVQMNEREKKIFLLEKGDLLFARQSLVASGAGKCSVVNNLAEETTFESHLIRVRLDESIANPLYYYYLFQLPYNPVKTIVNQCAQAGIRGTELVRIKVPLPDIEYQNTIANALFQYDKLIENNNKRIKLLEQMAENLYKEWFVRFRFPGYEHVEFIDGFPKEWKICRIDQLSKIKAGGDAPDDSTKEITDECSIPIYSNGIENEGLYGYTSKAKISKPSITISARGTVGYTCLRRVSYTPIVRLICVIPHEEKLVNWLFYYFKRTIVIANGTSQQQITIPMMSREKVLLPTNNLIQNFYEYSTCYLDEIDSLKAQNSNLEKQRDMLLPRLMSGKIEV